jgi:hypothetical protein
VPPPNNLLPLSGSRPHSSSAITHSTSAITNKIHVTILLLDLATGEFANGAF